jgi:hypothetical protein
MYLRSTQRRRKDGSVVRYLQLAHNRRVEGVTRAEVLLNLGREDEIDVEGLRRLAASITRFTDGDGGGQPPPGAVGEFEVTGSRPLGGVWLLDGLWRALRVDRALGAVLGPRRFTTDVERVLFGSVRRSYVKVGAPAGVLRWMMTPGLEMTGGRSRSRVVGVGGAVCRSLKTRRARWRLRQRSASRRLLPSACLRARLGGGFGIDAGLGHRDAVQRAVDLAVTSAVEAVPVGASG